MDNYFFLYIFYALLKSIHIGGFLTLRKDVRIRSCTGSHFPVFGLSTERYLEKYLEAPVPRCSENMQ